MAVSLAHSTADCFEEPSNCPDVHTECFTRVKSECGSDTYSDRYDDASATWVVLCAILMFFMKAGFLYVEVSFSKTEKRRRVVLAKYIDIFAGTLGFWLFGYAISGNTDNPVVGEEQDFIFWFFRFTFATNTATIIGGTLVGHDVQMRAAAAFVYSFVMTAFIHPSLARIFWSSRSEPGPFVWSPYETCNGTFTATIDHRFTSLVNEDLGVEFVFFDFAGSGLVHVCGGIAGFMLSVFHKLETSKKTQLLQHLPLLKRNEIAMDEIHRGKPGESIEIVQSGAEPGEKPKKAQNFIQWMYPSGGGEENVESAALGIIILWTTWFAFNCGSTESIAGKTAHAAVGRIALTMCLAAASGGITQCIISGLVQMYNRHEHFNTNEIANAVLANLVAVTGCCPFIEPSFSLLIGPLTVLFYHGGCFIEYLLKLHDGARVFPVHAVSGFWGLLCVGIFSRGCLIQELYEDLCYCVTSDLPSSVVDNHGVRFGFQLLGGLFIVLWSITLVTIVFAVLWYIPIKVALLCFPYLFRGNDENRGRLRFEGNLLFTHYEEIDAPGHLD